MTSSRPSHELPSRGGEAHTIIPRDTSTELSDAMRPPTAFQRHLLFFSNQAHPPRLTILSATRASLSLGLDLPAASALAISIRALYAPYPNIFSRLDVLRLPPSRHRTQLSRAKLTKQNYTYDDLYALLQSDAKRGAVASMLDRWHVRMFHAIAADMKTGLVRREDVERFQEGSWQESVRERRRGRGDVLPLRRGGPIVVKWHSLAVRALFGVRVYEGKE